MDGDDFFNLFESTKKIREEQEKIRASKFLLEHLESESEPEFLKVSITGNANHRHADLPEEALDNKKRVDRKKIYTIDDLDKSDDYMDFITGNSDKLREEEQLKADQYNRKLTDKGRRLQDGKIVPLYTFDEKLTASLDYVSKNDIYIIGLVVVAFLAYSWGKRVGGRSQQRESPIESKYVPIGHHQTVWKKRYDY